MENSILISIKKLLGIEEIYNHFDLDLIIHINSAFFNLNQLGVGPISGFKIEDVLAKWSDFVGERFDLESVKSYIYLKTRLVFDPPQMGYLVDAIKDQIKELEWRLNIQTDGKGGAS